MEISTTRESSHRKDRIRHGRPSTKGNDKKPASTFKTREEVAAVVKPTLKSVVAMVERDHEPTVPEWWKRLYNWLSRMEAGNSKDSRTFFFEHLSYEELENLILSVDRLGYRRAQREGVDPGILRALYDVEVKQASKIGPKGRYLPFSQWGPDKVKAVFSDKPMKSSLNKKAYLAALEDVKALVKAGSIGPGRLEDGLPSGRTGFEEHALNTDTNSCYATYVSHWYHAVWTKAVTTYQKLAQRILLTTARWWWNKAMRAKSWQDIHLKFVATAHQRTVSNGHSKDTEKGPDGFYLSKARLVIAMPKLDTLLGKPILNQVIEAVKEARNSNGTRIFTALTTPERIAKNMQVDLETAHRLKLKTLSTDYSSFDATLAPWFIFDVARAASNWMTPKAKNLWLALVYAEIYSTKLITPLGIVPEQPSSMKSGMITTNILDSLCNYCAQRYGMHAGYYGKIIFQHVQGDDGLLCAPGLDEARFEKTAEDLGLVANATKQMFEMDMLSFLQNIHILGYPGGFYPVARSFNSCISLEDDVPIEVDYDLHEKYQAVLSLRQVMRMQHCWNQPSFVEYVQLMKKEDSYSLGSKLNPIDFAHQAGAYLNKLTQEYKIKPWKRNVVYEGNDPVTGFALNPVVRVTHGDLPPPVAYGSTARFEWNYQVKYADVAL